MKNLKLKVKIRNLERQMGQIVNLLSKRDLETLPSHTEKISKETIKAMSLMSGKILTDHVMKKKAEVVNKKSETTEEKNSSELKGENNATKKDEGEQKERQDVEANKHIHALPFPQRMEWEKLDKYFGPFLEIL